MTIWQIILLIAGFGAIGGIVNSAISGEFNYPRLDPAAKVWRPGWIGNVLVGAVASVVVWGVYGPLASYDLVTGTTIELHLTVAQLLTSLVVGLSGGKILTLMAEKQAATISKDQLAATLSALTKGRYDYRRRKSRKDSGAFEATLQRGHVPIGCDHAPNQGYRN
jgi:hypothetical protein